MEIKILHLFYDLLNLYGEYGNISILASRLKDQGVKVIIDKKTINDQYSFNDYDFVYIGSGTENKLLIALEDMKRHKDDFKSYIDSNKVALLTGNSIEMLGKEIIDNENRIEGLNVFDFVVKKLEDRKTSDVILKSTLFSEDTVGFINKQANIENNNNHLFNVSFGIGDNDDNTYEGVCKNNLIATYVIGPLLIRNPHILKYIVEKIIKNKDESFNIKEIDYLNEKEGYELVLRELQER